MRAQASRAVHVREDVRAEPASGWWDVLGRARRASRDGAELSADLEMTPEQLALLSSDLPPLPLTVAPPAPIRVRFFGHACALVETAAAAVMFDPLVALRRRGQTDRFSFADLPERLDYVVITHGHLDHLDIETLLQVRHLTERVVVPRTGAGDLLDPNLKLILENLGSPCVVELDEFEAAELPGSRLTAVPFFGEHGDLVVRGKSGGDRGHGPGPPHQGLRRRQRPAARPGERCSTCLRVRDGRGGPRRDSSRSHCPQHHACEAFSPPLLPNRHNGALQMR